VVGCGAAGARGARGAHTEAAPACPFALAEGGGDDGAVAVVGAVAPAPDGGAGLAALRGAWRAAFPDLRAEAELILTAPTRRLTLAVVAGTQAGAWAGRPAAGGRFAIRAAEVVERDPPRAGCARRSTRLFVDEQTMFVQLGLVVDEVRAPVDPAVPLERWDAGDGAVEAANLARVRGAIDAWNRRAWSEHDAAFAAELVVRDQVLAEDLPAPRGAAFLRRIGERNFPDARREPLDAWAAGPYVVVETRFAGTAAALFGPAGGKPMAVRLLELYRLDGGTVHELWILANGRDFKGQLGVADPPAP
jgi:predicted ester cyclase